MYEETYCFNNGRNVPISIVANALGKTPQFIRLALQQNILPIGYAIKLPGSSKFTYYVSPKKLYEYSGFYYKE